MGLLQSMLNMGLSAAFANELENHYANVPETDFMQGLEDISRSVLDQKPPAGLPAYGEPWLTIRGAICANGKPPLDAFHEYVSTTFSTTMANAIQELVLLRKNEISAWRQRSQSQAGKKAKTSDYIHAIHTLGYSLAYNQCLDEVEINSELITDTTRSEILGKLYDTGFRLERVAGYAMAMEAWNNKYHPIRKYLTALEYDNEKHIERLAGYFTDEKDVFGIFLRRWLIGCCARAFEKTQNRVFVLDGPQRIGKSIFANWICPVTGYFMEGPIITEDKDSLVRLLNKFIWEVSEFGNTTRKADREALKAFITTQEVSVRKAYARYERRGPALANFIGTVNNEAGILNDPTGNRRFMIAKIKKIDWNYTRLDKNGIWSEAMNAYLSGESWNLVADESQIAGEINDEYEIDDPVAQALEKHCLIDPKNTAWWTSTLDIMERLQEKGLKLGGSPKANSTTIGSACRKLGLQRAQNNRKWGYLGIRPGPFP